MKPKDLPIFKDPKARAVLGEACKKHGVSVELLKGLLEIQRDNAGRGRQMGITEDFDSCFVEYIEAQASEQ
jgi:hypothetical protein